MATASHFRRFTKDEWAGEDEAGPPGDAYAIHFYSDGAVLAHCAGSRDRWERLNGEAGEYLAQRIGELPGPTQAAAYVKVIERDDARQRISMSQKTPSGWKVVEENVVPHLFVGQTEEDVV